MFIILNYFILIIIKIFFLVLGEGPTDGINISTGAAEKN